MYLEKYNLDGLILRIFEDKKMISDKFKLIQMLAEIAEGKDEAMLINKNNSLLKIRVLQSVVNMKESFKRYVFIFIDYLIEYIEPC